MGKNEKKGNREKRKKRRKITGKVKIEKTEGE